MELVMLGQQPYLLRPVAQLRILCQTLGVLIVLVQVRLTHGLPLRRLPTLSTVTPAGRFLVWVCSTKNWGNPVFCFVDFVQELFELIISGYFYSLCNLFIHEADLFNPYFLVH